MLLVLMMLVMVVIEKGIFRKVEGLEKSRACEC